MEGIVKARNGNILRHTHIVLEEGVHSGERHVIVRADDDLRQTERRIQELFHREDAVLRNEVPLVDALLVDLDAVILQSLPISPQALGALDVVVRSGNEVDLCELVVDDEMLHHCVHRALVVDADEVHALHIPVDADGGETGRTHAADDLFHTVRVLDGIADEDDTVEPVQIGEGKDVVLPDIVTQIAAGVAECRKDLHRDPVILGKMPDSAEDPTLVFLVERRNHNGDMDRLFVHLCHLRFGNTVCILMPLNYTIKT